MSTPAEQKGYKLGQAFWFIGNNDELPSDFDSDSPMYLHYDDGTHCPMFRTEETEEQMPKDDDGDIDGDYLVWLSLDDVVPHSPGKTPAQCLGYNVGDRFIMTESSNGFDKDQIVYLNNDDGTPYPKFISLNKEGDEDDYNYVMLKAVRKMDPSEKTDEPKQEDILLVDDFREGDLFVITGKEPAGKDPHHWDVGTIVRLTVKATRGRSAFVYHPIDNNNQTSSHTSQCVSAYCVKPIEKEVGEYSLLLESDCDNKVALIKAVRTITKSGLKEAKDLVEGPLPVFLVSGKTKQTIEVYAAWIKQAGAKYSIGIGGMSGKKAHAIIFDEIHAESEGNKQMVYFIDGESHDVTLVGYYGGAPVIVMVDRWGDAKPLIAKASLLSPKE